MTAATRSRVLPSPWPVRSAWGSARHDDTSGLAAHGWAWALGSPHAYLAAVAPHHPGASSTNGSSANPREPGKMTVCKPGLWGSTAARLAWRPLFASHRSAVTSSTAHPGTKPHTTSWRHRLALPRPVRRAAPCSAVGVICTPCAHKGIKKN